MIIDMEPRELSPDVSAIIFSGRFVLGNRLKEVEHAVRQQIEQGARKLVMDFNGVNYIDSAGIGVLAFLIGLMEEQGGKLVLSTGPSQVTQLMKLTRLDKVFKIYPDLESAQTALEQSTASPAQFLP
jgi:anti-sigma B factor antagonist